MGVAMGMQGVLSSLEGIPCTARHVITLISLALQGDIPINLSK